MIRVTNIQRMCFQDGPGIRTTVFLKGCNLHCPWCSNPENLIYDIQKTDSLQLGEDYATDELLPALLKDKKFWENEGGVTFSGGEALLQISEMEELLKKLKKENIHLAIETALFASRKALEISLKYIDYYFVDVKILDESACLEVLGGSVDTFFENIEYLINEKKDICFRIPCTYEYTFEKKCKEKLLDFLKKYTQIPVEIFSVHNLGESKYKALNKEVPDFNAVSREDLDYFKKEIEELGCRRVDIITI